MHQNVIKHDQRKASVKLFKRKERLFPLHDQTIINPEVLKEGKGYEEGHKKRKPGDSGVERANLSKV